MDYHTGNWTTQWVLAEMETNVNQALGVIADLASTGLRNDQRLGIIDTMNKNLHYGDITYEQPELPLEWPVHDHYTVELRKGERDQSGLCRLVPSRTPSA